MPTVEPQKVKSTVKKTSHLDGKAHLVKVKYNVDCMQI